MLHTRISEQLADDIRRLADDLRVPASNLVRNVLEEVFTMVESVSEDVGELFDDVLDEAEEARERVRRRSARRRRRHGSERAPEADRARRFDGWVERELEPEDVAREPFAARPTDEAASRASSTPAADDPLADVMGWQRLVLNHDRRCARCDVALPRGTEACLGLTSRGLVDTAVCRRCAGLAD